jgi:hypothetical protein
MPKAAKIALMVVCLVVGLGALVWYVSNRNANPVADRIRVVNVLTGEVMNLPREDERLRVMPGITAEGERLLYPLAQENGKWVINPRYQDLLIEKFGGDERLIIDTTTFASP